MIINKNYITTKDVDVLLDEVNVKRQNVKLSSLINSLAGGLGMSESTKSRISFCASFMEFLRGQGINAETGEISDDKKVMVDGFFCGNRFCPICSKNKARKDAIRLNAMIGYLKEEYDQRFLFLTLTVPNCSGKDLSATIERMNLAFNSMFKYKAITNCVNGTAKKVEVTYNSNPKSNSYDTYHPHFHVLLSVDKDYFYNPRKYIKHAKWLGMWQKAIKDNTISQVNVKPADASAVMEMSKYMAKDSDYLHSDEVFMTFYKSLKGKRLLTYSGNFKDALKVYEEGKLDDYKLDEFLIAEDHNESTWDDTLFDYDTDVSKISQLPQGKINKIKEKLQLRGYSMESLNNGNYKIEYVGKTTYGDDLSDD